jgi:Flp pilus assembly pilin Flp
VTRSPWLGPGLPRPNHRESDSDDSGLAAVEFALVVPLIVVLLFAVITAGTAAAGKLSLQAAARDGARAEAVDPNSGCTTAIDRLTGTSATVGDIHCTTTASCPGERSNIEISANRIVSIPILGDRTIALTASASYECLAG